MPRARIGIIACPACGIDADVRQAASGYVYVQCDDCSLQLFARSARSDKLLRSKMRPEKGERPKTGAPLKPKVVPRRTPPKRAPDVTADDADDVQTELEDGDHEQEKSPWD